jgi:hypothetical protein
MYLLRADLRADELALKRLERDSSRFLFKWLCILHFWCETILTQTSHAWACLPCVISAGEIAEHATAASEVWALYRLRQATKEERLFPGSIHWKKENTSK